MRIKEIIYGTVCIVSLCSAIKNVMGCHNRFCRQFHTASTLATIKQSVSLFFIFNIPGTRILRYSGHDRVFDYSLCGTWKLHSVEQQVSEYITSQLNKRGIRQPYSLEFATWRTASQKASLVRLMQSDDPVNGTELIRRLNISTKVGKYADAVKYIDTVIKLFETMPTTIRNSTEFSAKAFMPAPFELRLPCVKK
jgi:hypothetical protein